MTSVSADRAEQADGARRRWAYVPALDGLRGLSVLGPVLYHARSSTLPGGFLTIDLFFVLSSFLITSIALNEWDRTNRIDLLAYAGRRIRRLLPALLLCVAALAIYLPIAVDPSVVPRWTGSIVAALTYSANWFEIFGNVSYFEQFDDPSPLYHTWSLAIEEQFYLLVPFVVLGSLAFGARRGLRVLLGLGVVGAAASAWWMAHLYDGGDPSRVYYGTDTRAQGLLVGIALAALVRMWGPVRSEAGRRIAVVAGYVGVAYLVFAVTQLDQQTSWLFDRGGFLVLALAASVAVFATMQPSRGPLHRLLEASPTRYLGRITYGVYLYHWPIFLVVITPQRMAESGWWIALGLAITLAVASASYAFLERPIVERRVPVLRRPLAPRGLAIGAAAALGVIVIGLVVAEPAPDTPQRSTALPPPPASTAAPTVPSGDAAAGSTTTAPAAPLRVLVVGDSLMAQMGAALEQWAAAHPDELVVFNHSQLGCPVARGGEVRIPDGTESDVLAQCNEWATPVDEEQLVEPTVVSWTTAVEAFRPDVVLALVTPWDVADRRIPERGFDDWTHVGEPAYDDYVRSEYRAASEVLGATGARVLWMLGPALDRPVTPQNDPVRIAALNDLVRDAIATDPRATTVDYPGWLGRVGDTRDRTLRGDGMHLSPAGLEQVVPWLLDEIASRT
jgi:peptidoglycan/LPS O-acetylase OafA/YrhL